MISQIFAVIQYRLKVKNSQNLKILNNLDLFSLDIKQYQAKFPQFQTKKAKYIDKYKYLFNYHKILNKQYLIQDLVQYELIFVDYIYRKHLLPFYNQCLDDEQPGQNQLIDWQQQFKDQVKYFLSQYKDNFPQNVNRNKTIFKFREKDVNDIKILEQFLNIKQYQQHKYKISQMTQFQKKKYKHITNLIVGIINIDTNKLVGTGFLIAQNLVCTSLHVFGQDIQNKQSLMNILSNYRIRYKGNDQKYCNLTISQAYPQQIKPVYERKNQFDIIVLQIQGKIPFDDQNKLALMDFSDLKAEPLSKQPERHLALLIGYIQQGQDLILKKSVGQISIKQCIPLRGQPRISGSPIIMWSRQKKPFIVGVYRGFQIRKSKTTQIQRDYGVYARFNKKYFKQIQNKFIYNAAKDYINYLHQQILLQYIQQNYENLDHFLLLLITYVLQLNKQNQYFKELKICNLILNMEKQENFIFINNPVFVDQKIIQQYQQKQLLNLKSFIKLLQDFRKIYRQYQVKYKKHLQQSVILKYFQRYSHQNIRKQSLNSIIVKIDQQYKIQKNFQKPKTKLILKDKLKPIKILRIERPKYQYYTIYQKHFVHKPQKRLRQLAVSQHICRQDAGFQQLYGKNIKKRQGKIIQIINKRLEELFEYQNKFPQIGFNNFLHPLIKKLSQNLKQKLNKNQIKFTNQQKKHHKSLLQERISNYTKGVYHLSQHMIKKYRQYEESLFDASFEHIMKWMMIQDLHEYFQSLYQIIRGRTILLY